MSTGPKRYLLVTHIPFVCLDPGRASVDGLWARDLQGLAESIGPVRIVAPQLTANDPQCTWGPTAVTLSPQDGLQFVGFAPIRSRRDLWRCAAAQRVLRKEVEQADFVHTSNLFPPNLALSYAHDMAVAKKKKTLFVVAEDFRDTLEWGWLRESRNALQHWRRQRMLRTIERRVVCSARTASLTFLHTPAVVARYRVEARNGFAIRQPGHEAGDVISESELHERCGKLAGGQPLVVVAVCRHLLLKGIDLLISAIALLAAQDLAVEARIYGQGEMTEAWRALARRLGVADRVHFMGSLEPGPPVYRAIAQGHVFAMPHRTTDFGRAFFDAMAGGTPVLAFRNAASVDTVRDGIDGFLAPQDNIEDLAALLRRLHCDRALLSHASHAARERALQNTRSHWYRLRADCIRALFEQ